MEKIKGTDIVVLNEEEVQELTRLDYSLIVSLMYGGTFPEPIVIHGEQVGWSEKEVCEWMWIKAIEASWNSDSRWKGEAYRSLRSPSNLLGLNRELLGQIKGYLNDGFHYEDKKIEPVSVNPADPFGDALEMNAAKI